MRKKTSEITIEIKPKEDGIPTGSFSTVVNHMVGILTSLARQLAAQGDSNIEWRITKASMNSPLTFTVVGISNNAPLPRRVTREYVRSMNQIEHGAKAPELFTEQDLISAANIVSVLADGVSYLKFKTDDFGEVHPTQHLSANVTTIRQGHRRVYTSFRGRLHDIHTHGDAHNFEIYDLLTDERIRCNFQPECYEQVGKLLKRRVIVYGQAKYSVKGVPISIDVEKFVPLPDADTLPRIDELASLQLPNNFDAVDHVRKIRNGDPV